ncbi:alpha-L-fucosidase [Bacteroides xylanisolvens]|nr:alpha-L-fucosidase [Bacteroides xylanisolvens]MDB0737043.1 alpha-L-fucosidase [Bacteroides xylanisolvens]
MKRVIIYTFLFLSLICQKMNATPPSQRQSDSPINKTERMSWWTHDRFGLFIHWGLYAMPARHEWVKSREKMSDKHYNRYKDLFNPDLYNPEEWAHMAKSAGVK